MAAAWTAARPLGGAGIRAVVLAATVLATGACEGGPTAIESACADAEPLMPGEAIEGILDGRDDRFAGTRTDYFGLRLDAPARVALQLESQNFDPLLLLFETRTSVLAQAFDTIGAPPGAPETARLERELDAGCHLVGASAWDSLMAGRYRLSADTLPSEDDGSVLE